MHMPIASIVRRNHGDPQCGLSLIAILRGMLKAKNSSWRIDLAAVSVCSSENSWFFIAVSSGYTAFSFPVLFTQLMA